MESIPQLFLAATASQSHSNTVSEENKCKKIQNWLVAAGTGDVEVQNQVYQLTFNIQDLYNVCTKHAYSMEVTKGKKVPGEPGEDSQFSIVSYMGSDSVVMNPKLVTG
ncbi:hypothetical protein VNO77_32155 [Canavalia gladiata]|uniref:Uncharacterized protein n=1 Tax=Canavalia gladiata TaxID=3824 RepID=A0AAN9KT41_CANGL